ncbi:hypothetical protein O1611_g7630 [Lasiodiplodia mahajangana]|uniref:Uncharacterized protein n=1 Tax=Lasiodiplodia mahajangana TaxID=1108764 RepID=A0ACC2JF79_9PEZI|nr:hypothetical protein O1611_g7630 [Lasiodiplodia mahajangana]
MASRTVAQLEAKLKRFFDRDPRFRFVATLPGGATGDCLCYEERDRASGRTRKLVLKYPTDDEESTIDALKNEIKWIGEHHSAKSCTVEFAALLAAVAMAWPPAQGQAEEPKSNVRPQALRHWDMHDKNLLFGNLGPRQEHRLVPILKLIDFDNSAIITEEDAPDANVVRRYDQELELSRYRERAGVRNYGINANVLDIGITMTRVVAKNRTLDEAGCRRFIQHEHPLMDDDLQLLIVRCMAADPNNRPKLDELLRKSFNAVLSRTYRGTPYDNRETDAAIQGLVQRFILNA